jgi:hypothetical protein
MGDTDGDSRYHLPPVRDGKPEVLTGRRKERGDVVAVEGEKGGREFRSLDAPLEYYIARGVITAPQYRAGIRLHALWLQAQPAGHSQVQYEEGDGGGQTLSFVPPGFGAVEYREAMAAISCPDARRVAFAVCCEGYHASETVATGSNRTRRRIGSKLLQDALDDLVGHFDFR